MVEQSGIGLLAQWKRECPELANIDWPQVFDSLVAHVRWLFHVDPMQMIPGCGKTPEDIAVETCERFVLKEIAWKESRVPETGGVIALLRTAIAHAYLDHAFVRKKGKRVAREQLSLDATRRDVTALEASPEQTYLQRIGSGILDRLFEGLDSTPDRHPQFPEFVHLHLIGEVRPRDIASILNLPLSVVYRMRKRLQRRLLEIVPQSELEGRPRYDRRRRKQRGDHA